MSPLPKALWQNVRTMTAARACAPAEDRAKIDEILAQVRARYAFTAHQERVLRADARGCLVTTRSRSSGVVTTVWPAEDRDSGKYEVVCEAHSTVVGVDTMAMARHTAAHPTSFCDDCRGQATRSEDT